MFALHGHDGVEVAGDEAGRGVAQPFGTVRAISVHEIMARQFELLLHVSSLAALQNQGSLPCHGCIGVAHRASMTVKGVRNP